MRIAWASRLGVQVLFVLLPFISGEFASAASFGLSVKAQPSAVLLSETLTIRIDLTNVSGLNLTNVLVTNFTPASLELLNGSNSVGTVTNIGNTVVFEVPQLTNGGAALLTISAQPTMTGIFTNTAVAAASGVTNVTGAVVFSAFASRSDLGVTLIPPPPGTLVGDFVSYSIIVTNGGPDVATNFTVRNTAASNLMFLSVTPSNQVVFTNNTLLLTVSSLASQTSKLFQVTVQPTSAGMGALSASVSAAGVLDANATNNTATNSFAVGNFAEGTLVATLVSPQVFNPQTGLMEQTVRLTNTGTNDVAAARVFVAGLTNLLVSAVGTNAGNPFVLLTGGLAVGQSVDLVLEYFVPARVPVPDPVLSAAAVAPVILTPPATQPPNLTKIVDLGGESVLIEFVSIPGRSYTIVYSDNISFSNALPAQPPVTAPADRTQWIDDGPPKTTSRATNGMRFYRVFLNP